jgi:hypothetical protein
MIVHDAPVDLRGGATVEIKEAAQCEVAWGVVTLDEI